MVVNKIEEIHNVRNKAPLTHKIIMDLYIDNLYSFDDFYAFHRVLLEKVYGYTIEQQVEAAPD